MKTFSFKMITICLAVQLLLVPAVAADPSFAPVSAAPAAAAESAWTGKLPVVELPVPGAANDVLAIILSGDGGWADLDREFGKYLQQQGIATIGFDCLKYFWKPRKPDEAANALETVMHHYLKHWGKKRVLLMGYSFGASWLPLLVNRLPAELQDQISLLVLLAPAPYANLEIKIGDWFRDIRRPGALEVVEAAEVLRLPLLCVYGTEERGDSLCPLLAAGKDRRIMVTPGGHHFDHDYAPIQAAILSFFKSDAGL